MERGDDAVAVVLAWHAALNDGDADRLTALSTEEVEVGGPRGGGRGRALLREWVARAGVRLEPGRLFQRGGMVVVAQRATWRTDDGEKPAGEPVAVASLFAVEDGLVGRVVRCGGLEEALAAAGLGAADEVVRSA